METTNSSSPTEHPDYGVVPDDEVQEDLDFSPSEAPGVTRIEKFRAVVSKKSCMTIEGQPVDLFSANVVVQIHDALKPENRDRLMGRKTVLSVVNTAFATLERARIR